MAAGADGTPPPTPLRLKDLLELDCDSCSAAGFRCYPRRLGECSPAPVRHLLESPSLSLRRGRGPSKLSHLSRSLSRRLSRRGGFWRRRDEEVEEEDENYAAAAAATATATDASAGCGGSSSSEELELETSSESSDNSSGRTSRRSRSESDSVFSSATEASEDSVHHPSQAATSAGDEREVAMKRVPSKEGSGSGSEAEDKEQLSPVAVMDFPLDDDDEELGDAGVACSPSFSLARLQRRNTHKIRRFGSRDELPPLDLETLLATTSESDTDGPAADVPTQKQMIQCRTGDAAPPTRAGSGHRHGAGAGDVHDVADDDHDLISLLMGTVSAGSDDVSERLLLDFFLEMKKRRRSEARADAELPLTAPPDAGVVLRRRKAGRVVDGEAVAAAARGWLDGTGADQRWGLADVLSRGEAIVAETMERSRRWMQVGEEEREVGAVVAGMLADQLVDEVVREFVCV